MKNLAIILMLATSSLFTACQKESTTVIGGADGPTSIFIVEPSIIIILSTIFNIALIVGIIGIIIYLIKKRKK